MSIDPFDAESPRMAPRRPARALSPWRANVIPLPRGSQGSVPNVERRIRVERRELKLLLVEDSTADVRLVRELLREAGVTWQLERLERVCDAEAYLSRHRVDCGLLDLGVLDADGLDGLRRVVAADPELPVVVLTRREDDLLSFEALRHGAQDYLSKRDLEPSTLARAVRYAIERKSTELQLLRLASYDALTGVANRAMLLDRLDAELEAAQGVGVFFIDVDDLKLVNDSFGHDAGDHLLTSVARRIVDALRPTDTVARFGGDEFAVICPGLTEEAVASELASRVIGEVSQPLILGTRVYVPSVSVGVTLVATSQVVTSDAAIGNADLALYQAKRHGKGRTALFEESMRGRQGERLNLLTELRAAVVEGQLRVHYQPQVCLATGRLVAVEALVRWDHPSRGLLTAGQFFEVVEDSDMVESLGRWVLEQACAAVLAWPGADPPRVAVNVSPRQCTLPGFREMVRHVLATSGMPAGQLELEVTESALLVDEGARQALVELHRLGLRLAIDDYGTGYSSLAHLKLFPASTVKIDRAFVAGLGREPVDEAIVKAVLDVARSLALTTVGEGVETTEQRDRLEALGCELAQGFLFDRALPLEELYASYA